MRMEAVVWVFLSLLTLALSFASADIDNCLSSRGLYSAPLFCLKLVKSFFSAFSYLLLH